MKKIIGFADKFYTLWNYEIEHTYVQDSYGNYHVSGSTFKYYYLKNVSMDLAKVKELHPGVEIDDALRGTQRYFERHEKVELPEGFFWFGKYRGQKIEDVLVSDISYCRWVARNAGAQVSGYITNHPLYTPEPELVGGVKVGDEIEIEFASNGFNANDRTCWTKAFYGDVELSVECPGYRPVDGRYPYLMPEVNGKCLKTKGKTFKVRVKIVHSTNLYRGILNQVISIA